MNKTMRNNKRTTLIKRMLALQKRRTETARERVHAKAGRVLRRMQRLISWSTSYMGSQKMRLGLWKADLKPDLGGLRKWKRPEGSKPLGRFIIGTSMSLRRAHFTTTCIFLLIRQIPLQEIGGLYFFKNALY